MDELESQIAKIQLGNSKVASSFVFVMAEKAAASEAELYVVAELPLLNPAAVESCEKICLAIGSTLKRVYRKPLNPNSFELAIAQINEELGKLASLGQVHWINKLNCIIGVKNGHEFTIATCGKVAAFLYRSNEFTDISCSPAQSHPLKTFENYSTGRIRLGDLLILSTTQLFNYISMDRVKTIISGGEFLRATQTIIELLKDNAGPEVAFGTILNLQVEQGQTTEEEVDLENYIVEIPSNSVSWASAGWSYIKNMMAPSEQKRKPSINLPSLGPTSKTEKLKRVWRKAADAGRAATAATSRGLGKAKENLKSQNFRQYSPEKKFFLISLAVLLLAVVLSITVAIRQKKVNQQDAAITARLAETQNLLKNAETSFLYNDQGAAQDYLNQAQKAMPEAGQITKNSTGLYQEVSGKLKELEKKIQKQADAEVLSLGTLAAGGSLVKLPNILAVQTGAGLISYSKTTGRVEDGVIKSGDKIVASAYISNTNSAIYTGGALRLWNFSSGSLTEPFTGNVPAEADAAGLSYYPTGSKIYLVNKKTAQVVNFTVSGGTISRPAVSLTDSSFTGAMDLTIDTAIYVLTGEGIKKFNAGKPVQFAMPQLGEPISGSSKIYTQKDFQNLYVLDAANNRIIILGKEGQLVMVLTSSQFTKLVDFQVDEKGKAIYVLNDGSLLKVIIP